MALLLSVALAAGRGSRWLRLSVEPPPRGEEHLLVDALRRVGARIVERQGERFVAYLPAPADLGVLLGEAEVAVRGSTSLTDPEISWRWGTGEELAELWRGDVAPVRVTDRLVVAPVGAELESGPGDLVVRLKPGPGFGTAGHPTTRLCLRFLQGLVEPGARIADVGAGSGVLAITAALLGAERVLAFEADPVACATARENLAINGVEDRIEVLNLEVGEDTLIRHAPFDGLVANLEAPILLPLTAGFPAAVASRGWVVLSGALATERADLLRATAAVGLELREEATESGWWAAVLGTRPPPLH